MDYVVKTDGLTSPVSLDEAREHVRPDSDGADDVLIQRCIDAAVFQAETVTRSALSRRVYIATASHFPAHCFSLRYPPLVSVDKIIILKDGEDVTLDSSTYIVNTAASPGLIQPAPGLRWPSVDSGLFSALSIEYTAGYPTLDARIKLAILTLVAHYYENRQTVDSTSSTVMADLTAAMLADYIR